MTYVSPSPARIRPSQRFCRGFTLIELMVAIAGGLAISVAVFALARDATRFYQRESKVGDATLGVLVGFERLRADLARAGFLSSPNLRADPKYCGNWNALGSTELGRLASVRIIQDDPALANDAVFQNNKRTPDAIVLAGNYQSAEQYPMWGVQGCGTAGQQVFLQPGIGPLARLGYLTSADQLALLTSLFPRGRALRIADEARAARYRRPCGGAHRQHRGDNAVL